MQIEIVKLNVKVLRTCPQFNFTVTVPHYGHSYSSTLRSVELLISQHDHNH